MKDACRTGPLDPGLMDRLPLPLLVHTVLLPKVTVTDLQTRRSLCKDDPARFQISGQAVGIATVGGAIQYNTAYVFFGTIKTGERFSRSVSFSGRITVSSTYDLGSIIASRNGI
jgi:hypothetical protein